jgi:uncharacterized protein YndB with AHSA1/START domain
MSSVRQQIRIAVGARKVWWSFTTQEGLASWLAEEARVDSRAGGRIVLTKAGLDGELGDASGVFLTLRPTRKIEMSFDRSENPAFCSSTVNIQIANDGGETRVSLVHRGAEGPFEDEEEAALLSKQWKGALKKLRKLLESQ